MKRSDQINEIASALAKARGEFSPIDKGRTADTGKFKYDYADLADILDATAPALSRNGLFMFQDVRSIREPLSAIVVTLLTHSSGQWIESSELEIPCVADGKMGPAQLLGSAESYARRYQALAVLGVQPRGEDDDGNAASGNDAATTKREPLPACPKCGKTASVIVGKAEYGGGLLCFKKKEGCGHSWGTDAHPLTEKTGEGSVPSDQSNGKKQELPKDPPACKEYMALSRFVRNCGATTPDEATKIINWAVPGVGEITALRMMAGECQQIYDALADSGMTGPQIYAEAVEAAAV